MRLSTKLIISFAIIQSVELYIFSSLLDKAQQTTSQAAAPPAQMEIAPPNSTPQLIALEQEIAQLRAQLLTASTSPHTIDNSYTKTTPQEIINQEAIQEEEDSYEADIVDNTKNEQAYYATTQTLESAITSGYWTEHDTNIILENRHKLTEQQLAEITIKFYMHLDGGKMELQGSHPPL